MLLVDRIVILGTGVDLVLGLHPVEFEKGGVGVGIGIDNQLLLVVNKCDRGRILYHWWGHLQWLIVDKVLTQLIHLRVWLNHLVHLLQWGLTSALM